MPPSLKDGDENFYRDLFLTYYAPLTAFASKYVSDSDSAKDIVQSVFVKLFEKRHSLSIDESIKSYLYKTVSNACINFKEKELVRSKHQSDYAKSLSEISFHDALEQTEQEFKIFQAINNLPPQCRRIFILSRLELKRNPQIAEELAISVRTVETQISNALRTLRKTITNFIFF
jgi:RNA polymerase sigma-70 factor (family 1)